MSNNTSTGAMFCCSTAKRRDAKPHQAPKPTAPLGKPPDPAKPRPCAPGGHVCESGLLHFRQWWERSEAQLSVNGEHIHGTPILAEAGAMRVVNENHSYFIPLEHIDYIRTDDGFCK